MKLSILLPFLGATLAAADGTTCYHDGRRSDTTEPGYHAQRACQGYSGNKGAFQGTFGPGEVKYACVNLEDNVKLEMWVTNENRRTGFDLLDADCTLQFWNLLAACNSNGVTQGGASTVAGWRFRLDPNSGRC